MPKTPRFVISFNREMFLNLKQFIAYLCVETGLSNPTGNQQGNTASCTTNTSTTHGSLAADQKTYLLMLDDAILLNMDSIQENDRLSLIPSDMLQDFVTQKDEERRQESLERARVKAVQMHEEQSNINAI